MTPLVSIIVPVYNVEKYVSDCIESIIKQTYSNIEIIIINDGSTDDSYNVCQKYAELDSRMIVINKKNEGVSIARNIGLDNASGEWIMFVDSDDWIEIDTVEQLIAEVERNQRIGLVMGNYYYNFDDRQENMMSGEEYSNIINVKEYIPQIYGSCIINTKQFKYLFPNELRFGSLLHYPVLKIYNSKIIKENNIHFPLGIKQNEDKIFNVTYLKYVDCIKYVDRSIYHYRIRKGMASLGNASQLITQFDKAINEWERIGLEYRDNGVELEEYFCINTYMLVRAISNALINDGTVRKSFHEARKQLSAFCKKDNVRNRITKLKIRWMPTTSMKLSSWLIKHKLYIIELLLRQVHQIKRQMSNLKILIDYNP